MRIRINTIYLQTQDIMALPTNEDLMREMIRFLPYQDAKNFALTSKDARTVVTGYWHTIVQMAIKKFGLRPQGATWTDAEESDLIKRIYHVNGYTQAQLDRVTVQGANWRGPGGEIKVVERTGNISGRPGTSRTETWTAGSNPHRIDGPALISEESGVNWMNNQTSWMKHGVLHRTDGPAKVVTCKRMDKLFYFNGTTEEWYLQSKLHREGAPAIIQRGLDGMNTEKWYIPGKLHREGEPAIINSNPHGWLHEEWYQHGKRRRTCTRDPTDGSNSLDHLSGSIYE